MVREIHSCCYFVYTGGLCDALQITSLGRLNVTHSKIHVALKVSGKRFGTIPVVNKSRLPDAGVFRMGPFWFLPFRTAEDGEKEVFVVRKKQAEFIDGFKHKH